MKHNKIAILIDLNDKHSPSDNIALEKFYKSALEKGLNPSFITKDDFDILYMFDALFIRCVTVEDHYSMDFIKKSQELNLINLDSIKNIQFGSNKYKYFNYLTTLLGKQKIPNIPNTFLYREIIKFNDFVFLINNLQWINKYPLIVKKSNGFFSENVFLFKNNYQLDNFVKNEKDFLIQEYIPTDYDWRICILNNQPLFACKYHMVKDHWQIAKHLNNGEIIWGNVECIDLKDVPKGIIDLAIDSCKIISNIGLFGVDIKDYKGEYYLIEVNDNPSIEYGFEDYLLGDKIYLKIMQWYADELDKKYG